MIVTDTQTITDFLTGRGSDYKGRTFSEMLEWTDDMLEKCHDQIQWFFPLHEESRHAYTYPVITKEFIDGISSEDMLLIQDNLKAAKQRMDKFLGFEPYFDIDKQRKWCKDRNHNLLRITRIIRCLRIFGLEEESEDFYISSRKAELHFGSSQRACAYWWRARFEDVWGSLQD